MTEKNEKAWLCRIAANKCTDYLRQAGRRMIPTEDASMDAFHSPAGRPEQETLEAACAGGATGKVPESEASLR